MECMKITVSGYNGESHTYPTILEALREERVFGVWRKPDSGKFEFGEYCDECFSIDLTKDEVRGLAAELLAFIEHDQYCENCGQPPVNRLTLWDRTDGFGWRDMQGKNLCEECIDRAARYANTYGQ